MTTSSRCARFLRWLCQVTSHHRNGIRGSSVLDFGNLKSGVPFVTKIVVWILISMMSLQGWESPEETGTGQRASEKWHQL